MLESNVSGTLNIGKKYSASLQSSGLAISKLATLSKSLVALVHACSHFFYSGQLHDINSFNLEWPLHR